MCSPFEAAIYQYVKGRLSGEDLRRLQLHFQVCGMCRHQANVLRWRSMEPGSDNVLPEAPVPQSVEVVPPPETPRHVQKAPPPRRPMPLVRALLIGVAAGFALTLLLAPFVPSVFSVERPNSNIEFRHLNSRVEKEQAAKPARKRAAVKKTADPITMQLLTDDPDIVIHWTVE